MSLPDDDPVYTLKKVMDKVRKVIEENRKRKLTKHKKIPNNTVIEIDNCSPLEILKLQKNLKQIAVENYFIVHSYISNDRTDYNTLIPVLEKHRGAFGDSLEAVTADSGYCSEKNLLYLKENGIQSYIKLQDHEKRKARAYKEDIGKYYNMTYVVFEDEHYYICHDGRELRHIRTESKEQDGCIQTEGHFGDIKENENFRRFNYRSKEKVYKEFMLYAIGRNIMKYHRFLQHEIEKYEGKKEQKAA